MLVGVRLTANTLIYLHCSRVVRHFDKFGGLNVADLSNTHALVHVRHPVQQSLRLLHNPYNLLFVDRHYASQTTLLWLEPYAVTFNTLYLHEFPSRNNSSSNPTKGAYIRSYLQMNVAIIFIGCVLKLKITEEGERNNVCHRQSLCFVARTITTIKGQNIHQRCWSKRIQKLRSVASCTRFNLYILRRNRWNPSKARCFTSMWSF